MAANRHLARLVSLQVIYEYDFRISCGDVTADLQEIIERAKPKYEKSIRDFGFISELAEGVVSNKDQLDEIIIRLAPEWPLNQIAKIDLSILRIAIYEVKFNSEAVPPKVVINEAVELAKTFGSDSSSRFVNGVLGSVYKELYPELAAKDAEEYKLKKEKKFQEENINKQIDKKVKED
jgi:N utilization substance protein B